MATETYELEAFCKNCNFDGKVTIPKGMALIEAQCPNCSTKMLIKKLPPIRFIPHREDYS